MGRKSKIEWTGATWNPFQGCRKKSRGCKHCFMFREKRRYGQDPKRIHRSAKATFEAPLKWQREVERGDRTGRGRLVFTCSWSDWYIEEADEWRPEAWAIVRECKDLIFQILTKRCDRVEYCTPWIETYDGHPILSENPWPNVWLGFSAENQQEYDRRRHFLDPRMAAVVFWSLEPLVGPINLGLTPDGPKPGWVIVGGESGGNDEDVQPMHPEWVREIRDQCRAANVPFLFKQWGEWKPISELCDYDVDNLYYPAPEDDPEARRRCKVTNRTVRYDGLDGWEMVNGQDAFRTYRVGKKSAGRTLDGHVWDQYPALEGVTV